MANTMWIISRHPGAKKLMVEMGFTGTFRNHINIDEISTGDVVVGTLPVQLIAQLCQQSIEYWHISINLAEADRGQELSAGKMKELGFRIERYHAKQCC